MNEKIEKWTHEFVKLFQTNLALRGLGNEHLQNEIIWALQKTLRDFTQQTDAPKIPTINPFGRGKFSQR